MFGADIQSSHDVIHFSFEFVTFCSRGKIFNDCVSISLKLKHNSDATCWERCDGLNKQFKVQTVSYENDIINLKGGGAHFQEHGFGW